MRSSKEIWLSDLDSFSALLSELWVCAIFSFILVFTSTQNSVSHLVFKIIHTSRSEKHRYIFKSLREERWQRASLCTVKASTWTPIRHFLHHSVIKPLGVLRPSYFSPPLPQYLPASLAPFFPSLRFSLVKIPYPFIRQNNLIAVLCYLSISLGSHTPKKVIPFE